MQRNLLPWRHGFVATHHHDTSYDFLDRGGTVPGQGGTGSTGPAAAVGQYPNSTMDSFENAQRNRSIAPRLTVDRSLCRAIVASVRPSTPTEAMPKPITMGLVQTAEAVTATGPAA